MLLWLVFLPLIGGIVGWLLEAWLQRSFTHNGQCRIKQKKRFALLNKLKNELCDFGAGWVAFFSAISILILLFILGFDALSAAHQSKEWSSSFNMEWLPLLGIRFHLQLDGLSVLMSILITIIVIIAILYSRKDIHTSQGLFYFCLLFMTSAVMMLFMIMDLFLWFLLWEAIAIPIYFLITLWGRRDSNTQLRINGANKFLIYTQISGLLMLIAIISLALINWQQTEQWTFDYHILMNTPISSYVEFWLMLGFLSAFIVRIPLLPFHNWFIDAHVESSTTSSIMISGLLVNTAIYGLLRFVIPLFPNALLTMTPIMLILSVLTLFYSALVSFSQNDIKRLIAYTHIALMSFMIAAIFSHSLLAYQGIILLIISISFVIVGLFIISGLLVERYFTRNINQFFGLKLQVRYLSTLTLFFILAILGVPGTASFVGNFMVLFGSYENSTLSAVILATGLILLSISIIVRIQPIFYGVVTETNSTKKPISIKDLVLLILILIILFLIGLYPQWVFDISNPILNNIQQTVNNAQINLIKGDV